jgi:hypothetical protein
MIGLYTECVREFGCVADYGIWNMENIVYLKLLPYTYFCKATYSTRLASLDF